MASTKRVAVKPRAARAKQAPARPAKPAADGRIEVRTVNVPGYTHRVDAAKYHAAREALLRLLPAKHPGLTQKEMMAAMRAALPLELFPGKTTSWWAKTVQLDLEARGLVARDGGKPLRWVRAKR